MSTYPLTARAIVFGIAAGTVAFILTTSPLVGYSLFVLATTIGMTWRRDEPPVMPAVFAYQWLQITVGYFYFLIMGIYPDYFEPGNLELAIEFSLTGLLLIAGGIRVVEWATKAYLKREPGTSHVINLNALFWIVVLLYSVDFLGILSANLGGNFRTIVDRLLQLRQIPLLLLWIEIVKQGRLKSYLWLSLGLAVAPQLGTYFSDFKTPLILLAIVFAFFWQPWHATQHRLTLNATLRVIAIALLVVFLGLIWQGGVKRSLRRTYDAEAIARTPTQRVQLFIQNAQAALPTVFNDTGAVVEDLVSRLSYVTFFSRVLDYVPAFEPHANGELLQMALTNAFVPRFLAPNKAELPSDSYYTRRFSGILVSDTNAISISIGYLAEFYADWGVFGMFVSVFAYGMLMGLAMVALRYFCPQYLAGPAITSCLLVVLTFEQQFIKGFAALLMAVILAVLVTRLFGPRLARYIGVVVDDDHAGAAEVVRPRSAPTMRPLHRNA
ncbi:MAG: hypothetical protein LBQ09_01945 [Acidobacteriaceae bacterium]|jgi:hypothetical protein|nr:hypothetical protein [Acidobacteriaceae bacterium]